MRTDVSPTEFLKIASLTAEHFGFRTLENLTNSPACKECVIDLKHSLDTMDPTVDEVGGLLTRGVASYCIEKLHAISGPVLLYQMETQHEPAITFHVFNVPKSIAESILIQTNRALATELGHADHIVHINSLGDTDSITRYTRELTTFLRKRIDALPPEARERLKQHALSALIYLIEIDHEIASRAPNPLEYLSDQSRKHFRDIIEFLDMSSIAYEINPKLLGNHEYYSDALFQIVPHTISEPDSAHVTIRGGRFDEFVFRSTKKRTPAVGSVARLHNKTAPSRLPRVHLETPSVYVIQLGFGPKLRTLLLVDELRRIGIRVWQDLANDSLSAQLRDAENKNVSHVVIMGQKEYVDGTVILRDMKARKQEAVPFDQLPKILKKQAGL
jgi:histidyl-tRNA synthetase